MTDEIKQRIEMINSGEVPHGYKKTKVGIVPSEWEVRKLGKFIKIQSGCSPSKVEFAKTGISYYKVDSLNCGDKYIESNQYFIKKVKNLIEKNSIIFPKRGAAILGNKIRINNSECMIDTNLMALTGLGTINILFLYYYLIKEELYRIADTSTIPQINNKHIEPLKIFSPPLTEQEKIAEILTTCDNVIRLKEKLIAEKQRQKKYLMQNLLTGKKRLDGFTIEWEKVKLSKVLKETKLKNRKCDLRICSVAVRKGVVDQVEHLGRSYAALDTSNYNKACCGDVIYTKSPTGDFPYGVIKQSHMNENVAVSPLYGVFKPISYGLGYILHSYFSYKENTNNYLYPIIQKGAKNTMNISNSTFLSNYLYLPMDINEQTAIANIFYTADKEIEILQKDLGQWKQKKKALMQLLLAGKVRVK